MRKKSRSLQHKSKKNAPKIGQIIVMGDSLSDRGSMNQRKLFGFIPLRSMSGLDRSPVGRFTNGFNWEDDLANKFIDESIIQPALDDDYQAGEIADALISNDLNFIKKYSDSYNFDNPDDIYFNKHSLVRSYAEGGLTASSYAWHLSTSILRFFTRLIVATLSQKRNKMLNDDLKHHTTQQDKSQTLVIEWSGANDFITVNKEPSFKEAHDAIEARLENITSMIHHGYRHFTLFNMPDLSLTPRFQRLDAVAREHAKVVCLHFNKCLQSELKRLSNKYPHCTFELFDVSQQFKEIYDDPQKFGLDPNKQSIPFIESDDFKNNVKNPSGKGYMFWDDIHPSAEMHQQIAEAFFKDVNKKYNFILHPKKQDHDMSDKQLYNHFMKHYKIALHKDRLGFFGGFRKSRLIQKLDVIKDNEYQDKLKIIFEHALTDKGQRTLEVVKSLGWITHQGDIAAISGLKRLHIDKKMPDTHHLCC